MPTYRDLYDKLANLSQEQLDSEIMIVPVGYTDDDAASLLRYDLIPQVLELTKASRHLYHCSPSDGEEWMEAGVAEFSDDEIRDLEIDADKDYTLLCKKGAIIFKIKDNMIAGPVEEAHVGDLDTSILHL